MMRRERVTIEFDPRLVADAMRLARSARLLVKEEGDED